MEDLIWAAMQMAPHPNLSNIDKRDLAALAILVLMIVAKA